ncbi:cytochrome C oxidase subunit IV family protein [Ketobacter sp. MCCC 1A13808]|uniref:cytochrome C oxidase subunit IV family protein n=1 Tax=Ketobacter sp. MCCC 1A13808 TaxID=2602738 RepID=UPI0012EBBC37|nr:cytochrome C oxidase subunit IV family protein [Ketobacter sp. MCCC 1A13808]
MIRYIKNPLTLVWALLTLSTVLSWYISQSSDVAFQMNIWITISVLVIAIIKAQMVIRYFMEVRIAPRWLKLTMISWSVILLLLLLVFYRLST